MASVPSTEPKTTIKSVDMSDEMQSAAIEIAKKAVKDNNVEKDIAQYIKKEFDNKHGNTWHCIVGRNFGSFVTHETKHFIYFYPNPAFCEKIGHHVPKYFMNGNTGGTG